MAKFRKKPVVIDAVQWTGTKPSEAEVLDFVKPTVGVLVIGLQVMIPTLEGTMRGDVGDWIIRGVKSELYPCKPDIFAATYEPA